MRHARAVSVALACLALGARAQQHTDLRPPATTGAITAADLRARLEMLAADSLMGRGTGTRGDWVAAEIIADAFRRAGLEPAGENGTFFQTVPIVMQKVDPAATLVVDDSALALWRDFLPVTGGRGFAVGTPRAIDGDTVIFAGTLGDTAHLIAPAAGAGRIVVLAAPRIGPLASAYYWRAAGLDRYPQAAALAVVVLDIYPERFLESLRDGVPQLAPAPNAPAVPAAMLLSERAAGILLGRPFEGARPGLVGHVVHGWLGAWSVPADYPARNVVARLPGRDAALRGEFVSLSAHNDHVGFSHAPMDHDSLRLARATHAAAPSGAALDSARRVHPARLDSIYNGADDDGSGTVAILEIAEALASAKQAPRRSILFVSHTAEEIGLVGSAWYTDHPTVPRDSIVAEIDLDMVGRGSADDITGGGPGYLEVVGARRRSTELGAITDSLAASMRPPFVINYAVDAPGHPDQDYCRADHFSYARYGIPALNMSRGDHIDYHQVTDEVQYIDFDALARVATFAEQIAVTVADLDHRLVRDRPAPDPRAPCVQ